MTFRQTTAPQFNVQLRPDIQQPPSRRPYDEAAVVTPQGEMSQLKMGIDMDIHTYMIICMYIYIYIHIRIQRLSHCYHVTLCVLCIDQLVERFLLNEAMPIPSCTKQRHGSCEARTL